MRNALVAERVFQNLDDLALTIPLNDEHDWTELLGSQMGVTVSYRADLHSVLLFMLPEIERLLRPWPPPQSHEAWLPLANVAAQGLTPQQLYAALLAGPGRWLRGNLEAGTLETLPDKLQRLLVRSLAAELSAVVTRWVQWDIRNLKARRDALIAEQEAQATEERAARSAEIAAAAATKKAPRRPPSPEQLADRAKERGGHYQPRGRT